MPGDDPGNGRETETGGASDDRNGDGTHGRGLVDNLLSGDHRALARVITKIENREPGYRDVVSALFGYTGDAGVVGVTGSPGAGKSTLVDKLAKTYRERGLTVGVIAVDPASPYTGGAVLGDRIRMASNAGDMDVFFRSMSARGQLGGLSTATGDAVKALDAFGKDRIIVETVGAGQNEVDVVRTADTVCVLVQPGSGDDVQMLKAGILEIGDVFVVNKADREGASQTVAELEEMLHLRESPVSAGRDLFTDDAGAADADRPRSTGRDEEGSDVFSDAESDASASEEWSPRVVETVATTGEGVAEFIEALEEHREYLVASGRREVKARNRYAEEIRRLVRADVGELAAAELDRRGGVEALAAAVVDRETDPYAVADDVVAPIRDCAERGTERDEDGA